MPPERFGSHIPPQARRPVPWYAPIGLRQIAQQQLWSTRLLHNLDRRETFTDAAAPFDLIDLRGLVDAQRPDFWVDFVADTGDGGSATYAVARGLLAPALAAEGAAQPLPEAQLLLLGGDLAYPAASPQTYQARLVEMFELARDGRGRFDEVAAQLPASAPFAADQKLLAAIPQNHDWFDSASTFCRYFVNEVKAGLVGARAPQTRSYFAFALPHDWFVLGFDFALTGDLDRAQYEAFARLVETGRIPRGAQLILLYPEPTWTRPFASLCRPAYPLRFQRLEHLFAQSGLDTRMRLSGDLHHYVRERLPATPPAGLSCDLVTCGSGGAFGHATHTREVSEPKALQWASETEAVPAELRGRIVLGRVAGPAEAAALGLDLPRAPGCRAPEGDTPDGVNAPVCYPDVATSRRLAWGNLWALLHPRGERLPHSNQAFALLLGALLLGLGWALPAPDATPAMGLPWLAPLQALLTSPTALVCAGGLGLTGLMLATDNDPARAGWAERVWGAGLAIGLLGLAWVFDRQVTHGWLAPLWPAPQAWPPADGTALWALLWRAALAALLAWGLASVAAALATGAGLLLLGRGAGRALNNSSSALSLQGHKGFLRLRVHPGGLEAFMLGQDAPPQRWEAAPPTSAARRPHWEPADRPLHWRVVDHFEIQRPDAAR